MNKKIRLIDFDYLTKIYSIVFWSSKSPLKGSGLEFKSLREYSPWDNVKHIDWLISAREGKTYIKEHEEDKNLNVVFLLDVWEYMSFWSDDSTKLDNLKFTFKTLALSALKKWYNVSWIIFDDKIKSIIPSSNSKIIVKKIEDKIILSEKESNLGDILSEFNKLHIKKSLVFIISDNDEIKNEKEYRIASTKNDVIYINIFDHFENFLWWDWFYNFVWKISSLVNFRNSKKVKQFSTLRKNKILNFRKFLIKNRILYLYIDNKKDIYKELLNFLKK